jgi:hypothetical protein
MGRYYRICSVLQNSDHKGIIDTQAGITRINYNPEDILQFFYNNFEPIASFTKIKPVDFGIWNLHLMHKFLYLLLETNSVNEVQKLTNGSSKSLHNKIRFAREIRLVEHAANSDVISLTEFGKQYVAYKNNQLPERLSEAQGELLRNLVIRNPYESPVILGIASIVEAVFALSKNTYPVPMRHLIEYFSYYAGKYFDWQTNKAKYSATLMYSNYATDLGLLGKTGDTVYLTPEGFRFTIQMQLHKSLKMMESLKLA